MAIIGGIGQSLPRNVSLSPSGASAWQILLDAEEHAARNDIDSTPITSNTKLVNVRVLGYFLLDLWEINMASQA